MKKRTFHTMEAFLGFFGGFIARDILEGKNPEETIKRLEELLKKMGLEADSDKKPTQHCT